MFSSLPSLLICHLRKFKRTGKKKIRAHSKVGVVLFCLAGRGWTRTEIIIMAPAPRTCSARSDHRIRELNAVIYGVLRFIMESCAKGYEVVVSGKLRGQRAKSMTFVDGMMIHSDDPCKEYSATATPLRQGELGIQVKIVLPWDPNGNIGPKEPLSDNVEMVDPS
ncbi:40S ribosomal protein S3-like [Culex pipiens pallens]|uniref:40S ribosomal protein S3-like n=1 Tax=Culex pipiens pallens TaxID=42434 RepID=UPI001954F812|nr:40S ribosomal protein S3-like [Culex pipiens pallens]